MYEEFVFFVEMVRTRVRCAMGGGPLEWE